MVYDSHPQSIASFKHQVKCDQANAVHVASSPFELAQQCQVIVTMLPSSPHVLGVYLNGAKSSLAGLEPNTLLIDSSTIDPAVCREVYERVMEEKECVMVDAPVSGGTRNEQCMI